MAVTGQDGSIDPEQVLIEGLRNLKDLRKLAGYDEPFEAILDRFGITQAGSSPEPSQEP